MKQEEVKHNKWSELKMPISVFSQVSRYSAMAELRGSIAIHEAKWNEAQWNEVEWSEEWIEAKWNEAK